MTTKVHPKLALKYRNRAVICAVAKHSEFVMALVRAWPEPFRIEQLAPVLMAKLGISRSTATQYARGILFNAYLHGLVRVKCRDWYGGDDLDLLDRFQSLRKAARRLGALAPSHHAINPYDPVLRPRLRAHFERGRTAALGGDEL